MTGEPKPLAGDLANVLGAVRTVHGKRYRRAWDVTEATDPRLAFDLVASILRKAEVAGLVTTRALADEFVDRDDWTLTPEGVAALDAPKPLAVGDVKRNEAGEPLLCVYPNPCIGMQHHTVSGGRSGIHQLDNRIVLSDPKWRPFHMGFALKPSPHPEAGKRGVLLNFCPWCGADLMAWLAAYQADIDAHKATLKAEHEMAGQVGLATVDDAKPAKRSRKAVRS